MPIDDIALKDLQQASDLLFSARCPAGPVEVGIGLDHVQMGIHRLRSFVFGLKQVFPAPTPRGCFVICLSAEGS